MPVRWDPDRGHNFEDNGHLHGPAWWHAQGHPRAHRQDAPFFYGMEAREYRREKAMKSLGGQSKIPEQGPYAGTRPHATMRRQEWRGAPREPYDSRKAMRYEIRAFNNPANDHLTRAYYQRAGGRSAARRRMGTRNVLVMLGLQRRDRWRREQ